MAYDRDRFSNPLRRLRGHLTETQGIPPMMLRHLNQAVDDYLAICPDFPTQQAAAKGIWAHYQAMRCEAIMQANTPGTQKFNSAMLSYYKLTALCNTCFRLAKEGSKGSRGNGRTASRPRQPGTDTGGQNGAV